MRFIPPRILRAIAVTTVAIALTTACTPAEIAKYLESTEPTRDALSAEQLSRLRECESTDNYRAVSRSGLYRGAYQFDRNTWDSVAERHFEWLVDRDPVEVEPWWQDAMARALWSERGRQPWPVCGKRVT